jgi:pyruvate/2-oxoacid:ferredoxin oxidoreductase beta subunit
MTMTEIQLKYSRTPEYIIGPTGYCPGCPFGLSLRYFLKATGPNVIIHTLPGCFSSRRLEHEGKPIDITGSPFANASSFCAGVSSALEAQGDTDTVVVPWAGDGATFDIGMGQVSAAAERNDNILYVCNDNEAYQNTGNQRSSAAPWMSTNATNPAGAAKLEFKKDMDLIMAAHGIPYLATVSVAYPDDFMRKVAKAKAIKGFRFIHILNPCPAGWGFSSEKTMEIARLSVETSIFPLFEVENGVKLTITHTPKGLPVSEYVKPQQRFRSMSQEDLARIERDVQNRWHRIQFLASYDNGK